MGPGLRRDTVLVCLLGLTQLLPGKWVYEVLISSQGLMQIGWCTINCRFNQEVRVHGRGPSPLPASSGLRTVTQTCPLEEDGVPPLPRATWPRTSLNVSEH